MTDVSRLSTLRYALHTDASTFSNTPGTLLPLRITDDGAPFLPRQRTPIARNLRSLGGRRYSHVRGLQDVGDLTVPLEFRGVDTNSGGAVADWEAKMEQGQMLASMFGAVAVATTGAAPTVAAAGHTPGTGTLVVVGTTLANTDVIGFATSDGFEVAKVSSGGGTTTITLEHPFTGTPTTGATVFRFANYLVADAVTHHVHAFFSAEGEHWRRDYFGCAPMSFSLEMSNAGVVSFSSVWSPTSWSDVADANPTHAEPVAGSPVVMDFARLWFGGSSMNARDFSLTYSNGMQVRRVDTEVNAKLGGVAAATGPKEFRLEFSVYVGATSLAGELQDSTGSPASLAALLGSVDSAGDVSATREVALQVGTEVGACFYVHMATADCQVTTQIVDGLTMARVVCVGTGAVPGLLAVG
jgi:hypothetical protein